MCYSLFQTGLTFVNLTVVVTWRSVTLGRILVLIIIACLMPIKHCAKIENTQIRLLINDEDLLNEKLSDHEAASRSTTTLKENHEDHYNLYRSELKRLSYETIYRILRDENEPMYRPEDVEMRYYQKRSPSSSSSSPSSPPDCHHSQHHHHQHHHYDDEENHDLQKRSLKETTFLNLTKMNLKKFPPYPHVLRDYETLLSLDLSENYLETVNMEEFSRLQFLNLSHNRLTYLPLWRNSSLISLNLNYNRLKSFSLAYNVKLRELYLCCNEIASLASSNFTILYNLEVLDLSGNRLESLDSSLFPQMMHSLRVLNLADNQFVTVYRETFYNLLSLNTLLLAGNNISDIDYETFLALPNLQYLDLSYNQLQGKSIRALQGITGLVALSIAFNPHLGPYMQEFVASWSLKELDASGTGLCQIPAALALSVRSLGLTHNWLKIINCGDLDSYPLLQYLDLSFSRIEEIEDDALGRLEILEILMLDHNSLRKVPMSLPNSLEHLFLQHNDIMDLQLTSFQGLNNLQTLDLSYNKLLYLPALPLPKLQTLNLQSSDLRGINQAIVHTLPRLSDLMLEENPIKCSDLLGIAEWASSCRLTFKEEEQEFYDKTDAKETTTTATAMSSDLKRKFIKIHNFYEKFQEQQQKHGQQNKRNKSENLMEKTAEEEFTPFCAREVEREKSCHENEEKTANVKLNIKKEDISQEGLNSNTMAVKTTATPATATATKTITMFSTLAPTVAQRTLSSIEIKNNEAVVTDTAVQTTYSTKIEIRQSKRDQENENNIKNNNKNKMSSSNRNSNITTKTLRNSVTRKEATTVPEQQHSRQQEKITEIPILAATRDQLDAAATAGAALTEDIPNTVRAERRANHNKTLTEKQMAAHLSELPTTTAATAIISAKKSAITISASPAPAPTQTKVINSLKFKTANKTTTFTIASTTTSASITRVPRTDMNFELKALNLTLGSTNIYNRNNPANTETNTHNVNMSISNKNKNENHSNYNNSVNIVLASNMQALNNKDLISNSNSNSNSNNSNNSNNNNNNNRKANGNSTTTNNSNNKIMIVTPSSSPSSSSSTSIASHETNTLPVKWNKTAITTTTTTMATTITNVEDMMIKYKKKHNSSDRAFVENDVNAVVKCMQSNSNDVGECISIELQQVKQQENEVKNEEKIGTLPTTTIARQAITTTSKPMTSTIQQQQQLQQHQQQQRHKHEPLQLQVRDRHLIGTPLLMHKGENLMVEADELILTKKKPMTKAPTIATKEITKYIKGNDAYADGRREQHHLNMFLDKSQLTKPLRDKEQSDSEMSLATVKTTIQAIKSNSTEVTINKAKKPSLMMKKMTIITKQHESQPHTFLTNEDNEVIAKTFDNMNFQELRPKETKESHGHKHSTVNTPLYQIGAKAIHEPHTFQHEHDMIMKQLLQHQQQQHQQQHQQQQRQQQDVKISKTEHWLDIRKSDKRNSHSGLVLLMSLGLFVVLLLGLMHVYRCDIPWRRHISATSATAQLRPHQRHNSSMEDDSHSFLSYQEGVQKWHHSTRQQPPYSSPLHNLHVRELQKTSATEVIPIVRTSATTNISTKSQQHWNNSTLTTRNSRCSVNSQSTSSSTASSISASSSAILDDESFYIEMTPDSGQIACALNSELLPMELLNLAKQKQSRRDLTINSITQTSMGDDHTAPPQQQQQQQQLQQQRIMHTQTVKTLSSTSSSSPAAPSIVVADTKQLAPSARKFSLW